MLSEFAKLMLIGLNCTVESFFGHIPKFTHQKFTSKGNPMHLCLKRVYSSIQKQSLSSITMYSNMEKIYTPACCHKSACLCVH